MKKCLFIRGREPVTDQSNDCTKVKLAEPMNLLKLFSRVWIRGFVLEHGSVIPESLAPKGDDS